MLALAVRTPVAAGPPPLRRARWAALALDCALGVALAMLAFLLGAAWLLWRTGGAERDVPSGDAALAFGLVLAAVPAWLAWLAFDLATRGATPGQRARGLVVAGEPWRRLLRLALHPLGGIGWAWLFVLAEIAALPAVSLILASVAIVVFAAGLVSAALTLQGGGRRGVHDRLAGTRLQPASTPASSPGEPST